MRGRAGVDRAGGVDGGIERGRSAGESFRRKEAASSTVTVRDDTPCLKPGCGCKHIRTVKVPDYKLKLQIIEFLANRGVGRPQQAEAETGEAVHFEQVYDWGCENCNCEDCLKDRGEKPKA